MSLVARHLEANGLPTVIIGSALDIVEHCGVPRFLFTDFPLGNPCGHPWRRDMQKKIACPLLVLWGQKGAMNDLYDVMAIWRERANKAFGKSLPAGHNLQEDVPERVLAEIEGLLKMA